VTDIPSRDEPDPQNLRQRSFQGGADSLPDASPADIPPQYRDQGQTAGATAGTISHSPTEREGGARVRIIEQR
jgi:hypothetical protein